MRRWFLHTSVTMETTRLHRVQYRILLVLFVSALSRLVRHTGAVNAGGPRTLQEALNQRCVQLYNDICKGGRQDFCQQKLTPVARKGVGTAQQNERIFRCYDVTAVSGDQVDKSEVGVECVDNCGHPIRCKGTVKRAVGSFHASRHDEILKWIEAAKPTYCSEVQTKLDNTCNSKAAGSLGRILEPSLELRAACVSPESLVFEDSGYCFNQCGLPIHCPGKPASGQQYAELSATDIAQLYNKWWRPCKPYQTCTQDPGEPVRCTDESDYQVEKEDNLQRWMDQKCKAAVEQMCKSQHKSTDICTKEAPIVLRKGYGHSGQTAREYRCYYAPKLENPGMVNTGPYGVSCVDNCGKDVPCGGTVNVKSMMHHTTAAISSWINEGKSVFCSAYQRELQNLCDKDFPGSLARYGVSPEGGRAPVGDDWKCAKPPLVEYERDGRCMDSCGRTNPCAGGTRANGAADSTLLRQISPEQIADIFGHVESPCLPMENCVASSRNPPQCKPKKHEAGTSGGNTAPTMQLEDGDTLETTFSSLSVGVSIGDCYQAKLDLASRRIEVGSGDRSTVISTQPATPPSKLSVHRSGNEVTLTLLYNMGTKSGRSLFYAQPDASCVARDPVVFDGLEPEALGSRTS